MDVHLPFSPKVMTGGAVAVDSKYLRRLWDIKLLEHRLYVEFTKLPRCVESRDINHRQCGDSVESW